MITTNLIPKEANAMTKVDEYKSQEGVRFKAKLMGNTVVEEQRGKTVAEYAMAKLKLNVMKQKQHKTRVNISLKWDGFFVYLSDGGQELLHSFPLETISFVWKDPCDDRALGIICSDGSIEKQTLVTKFYGYKTEKPALPLIMALKELFGLRTNEHNETREENEEPKNIEVNKEETQSSIEDLLDLKVDISKPSDSDFISSASQTANADSKWITFSKANSFTTFPPNALFPPCVSQINTLPAQWQQYPATDNVPVSSMWNNLNLANTHTYSNPFSQPMMFPVSNNYNIDVRNPFGPVTTNTQHATIPKPPISSPTTQSKPSSFNHTIDNLFSDLLITEYCLAPKTSPRQPSVNSLNSNGKEASKMSLAEMKKTQEIKEPIDFSVFEKNNTKATTAINNQKIESNPIGIPIFQFD